MKGYRGTRDFLPDDWAVEKYLFNVWRSVSESYGFREYEAPILEPVELFTAKSGEEIKEQLFWFKDKGGRDVCLRAELTPQLARYVVQYGTRFKKPIKWFSMPRLFRYERPQKGRVREFFQYNADIVGDSSARTVAEIISLAISIIRKFKLSSKVKIRINSRLLIESIIRKFGIKDKKGFYSLVDKRYKLGEKEFFNELKKLNDSPQLMKLFKLKGEKCLDELGKIADTSKIKEVLDLVDKRYVVFDLSIVRGLDYYTDIVFEGFDVKGRYRALLGGGEYDDLISDFGGPKMPAVGFGMGDAVLIEMLKEYKLIPSTDKELIFIATVGNVFKDAMKIAEELREKGKNVFLNTSKTGLSKQVALADDLKASFLLIVGEKDLGNGVLTLRDMRTGNEKKIKKGDYSLIS